jgi:chitin disaccharide deacetylase
MGRQLIVNADDFGRAPGVTRGILEAHHEGSVGSTTMMVNLPWSDDAAVLGRNTPSLAVGLHLSFCYGPPLAADVPSLLDAQGLLDRDLIALRDRATATDIEREARAQLACFVALMGSLPSHLDSHQHVHTWPVAVPVVAALAREHELPVRGGNPGHIAALRNAGVTCPDHFIVDYFGAGRISAAHLAALLHALPEGVTELMCHPGFDDPALADSSYRVEREEELRVLTAPQVREVIASAGVELISFRDLRASQ